MLETIKSTNDIISSFESRVEQITMKELAEQCGVYLIHALPDDSANKENIDTGLTDYTTYKQLNNALNRVLSEPVENLSTSSVHIGDEYARWFGRFFGVVVLDGTIVEASKSDGNRWHKQFGHFTEPTSNKDILHAIDINNPRRIQRNELNVRTDPSALVPLFDLDYLFESTKWGATFKNDFSPYNLYDQLRRFESMIKQLGIPPVVIYEGELFEANIQNIVDILPHYDEGTPQNDNDIYEYHTIAKQDRAKLKMLMKRLHYSELKDIAQSKNNVTFEPLV